MINLYLSIIQQYLHESCSDGNGLIFKLKYKTGGEIAFANKLNNSPSWNVRRESKSPCNFLLSCQIRQNGTSIIHMLERPICALIDNLNVVQGRQEELQDRKMKCGDKE